MTSFVSLHPHRYPSLCNKSNRQHYSCSVITQLSTMYSRQYRLQSTLLLLLACLSSILLRQIHATTLTAAIPPFSTTTKQRALLLTENNDSHQQQHVSCRGGGGSANSAAWTEGLKNSLASALAAACSKTILAPFDTIKTIQQHYQTSSGKSLGFWAATQLAMSRPRGFWELYVRTIVYIVCIVCCCCYNLTHYISYYSIGWFGSVCIGVHAKCGLVLWCLFLLQTNHLSIFTTAVWKQSGRFGLVDSFHCHIGCRGQYSGLLFSRPARSCQTKFTNGTIQ